MQSQRPEGVKGFSMTDGKTPSKQHGKNRTCAEEGCQQKLSIYNPGKYCSAHENPRDRKDAAGDGRSSEAKWKDVDKSLRLGRAGGQRINNKRGSKG